VIEFAGYIFDDHKASLVCNHVTDGHPVLLFVHDSDGDIQFMCGAGGHEADDAKVVGISHLLEHIRSISDMPTVDPGFLAERTAPGEDWDVQPIEP
jgi:hypothetical protein